MLTMQKSLTAFGRALREARGALSQADLGDRLAVTASAVGNWERGEDEPSPARVRELEEALELQPGSLSHHLGYTPTNVGDPTDLGSRIARLSANAQQVIKDIIDAEERRMGER